MAADKSSGSRARDADLSPQALLDAAHQVWLAGVGAVAKARKEGPKAFEQLMKEGARAYSAGRESTQGAIQGMLEQVQERVGERVAEARTQAADALESLENVFQTRVHRALAQLGVPRAEEIQSLGKRVQELNANIERLIAARGRSSKTRSNGAARSRAKRSRARKSASGRRSAART